MITDYIDNSFAQNSFRVFLIAMLFVVGYAFGQYHHPYETCSRMYENTMDVMECVWLKEKR